MASVGFSTSRFIKHPNGQVTHCVIDDFVDPWKPAQTILIQHGFGRHHAFWYHWVPALAREFKIVRRDTRGHGLSSVPNQPYDLDMILEEIIDTLDQLKLDKVHFLGESTSGMLGEALAARHPDRLHSLILCSAPSHLPKPALDLFAFGHESWPIAMRKLGSRGWAEALSAVSGTVDADLEYNRWWIEQVARSPAEGLAGYAEFLSNLDGRPFLRKIKVRTLILAPAQSAATKLEEQKWIQNEIKDSELIVVYAKGHEIYVQEPEVCQRAVVAFIRKGQY